MNKPHDEIDEVNLIQAPKDLLICALAIKVFADQFEQLEMDDFSPHYADKADFVAHLYAVKDLLVGNAHQLIEQIKKTNDKAKDVDPMTLAFELSAKDVMMIHLCLKIYSIFCQADPDANDQIRAEVNDLTARFAKADDYNGPQEPNSQ